MAHVQALADLIIPPPKPCTPSGISFVPVMLIPNRQSTEQGYCMRVQALADLIISPSQALRTSAPFGMLLRQVLLVGNHLNQGTAK